MPADVPEPYFGIIKSDIMKGCRPFSHKEVQTLLDSFKDSDSRYALRNRAWFAYGVCCGFRITELLSLRIKDVSHNFNVIDYATVKRAFTKGKREGSTLPVEPWAKKIMQDWLDVLKDQSPWDYMSQKERDSYDKDCDIRKIRRIKKKNIPTDWYVFQNQQSRNSAISRQYAYEIMIEECSSCGIYGNLGTHSMRKTFANIMRDYWYFKHQEGAEIDPKEMLKQSGRWKSEEAMESYLTFLHMDKDEQVFPFDD